MNISEQIFNELNIIIKKLEDPNISTLEKDELIKRKEDLTKRFHEHCKSGEVTPIKVLSSLVGEEDVMTVNYSIENKQLALESVINSKNNKENFNKIIFALDGAKEKLDGRGK